MRILAIIVALALALGGAAPAAAQAVLQAGPWTKGHAPGYTASGAGSVPRVQDSGPAGGGGPGLTEGLYIAPPPPGAATPPYAASGTGPFGTNWCDYDAPITSATYHYICLSPNAQGGGLLAYGVIGSPINEPLSFLINGVKYNFPITLSGVLGPVTSVIGDVTCWNNNQGTLLYDCGLPASINVQAAGMQPSTISTLTDNYPFLGALMSLLGPPVSPETSGYDVDFPGVPGTAYTEYYFSNAMTLSRGANYHCSGTVPNNATYLIFAPGVDGVIQESFNLTGNGSSGGGTFSGCHIWAMGTGTAISNPITPTVITNVAFLADPAGIIPAPTWTVGDGIILVPGISLVPRTAVLLVQPGTTVGAVSGSPGNYTVTLSGGSVTQDLGWTTWPKSSAVFTETSSNNFVTGDTIQVGSTTYTFTSSAFSFATAANTVQIGVDFPTSAANLVAAIMHTTGEWVTYIPNGSTSPDGWAPNHEITAAYASFAITFTSRFGSPNANTLPSVYTAAGTAAGTFPAATFTGANDSVSCPAPCTASNDTTTQFYQLPVAQAFKIQTTSGSHVTTVISGPRAMKPGDAIWTDAFPFGTQVWSVGGTTFPQTVNMTGPTYAAETQNATATHLPGAEANAWVLSAALKRRTAASARENFYTHFPIALDMPCSEGGGINCDLSRDEGSFHNYALIGRWASGNNYATSSSINDQFNANFVADIVEGGGLGEVIVNPNTNSGEEGHGKWGFLKNCANQNETPVFGGYMTNATLTEHNNGCLDPVNLYPPTPGGPLVIGQQAANAANGPYINQNAAFGGGTFSPGFGSFTVPSGNDGKDCLWLGSAPAIQSYVFAFGHIGCAIPAWELIFDNINLRWGLYPGAVPTPPMVFVNSTAGGYIANGTNMAFPFGEILGGDGNNLPNNLRFLGVCLAKPTGTWHLAGDVCINTAGVSGQNALWYDAPSFTTTLSGAVTKASTTSVSVAACPAVALPAGTPIVDTTPGGSATALDLLLGLLSSCSGTTLTFQAVASNNGSSSDAIAFMQWQPGDIIRGGQAPILTTGSCSGTALAGGKTRGTFTAATCTAGTYIISGLTGPTGIVGWNCFASDRTTPADLLTETASGTTSATLLSTTVASDVIQFSCDPY